MEFIASSLSFAAHPRPMATHNARPYPGSSSSNSLGSFLWSTFAASANSYPPTDWEDKVPLEWGHPNDVGNGCGPSQPSCLLEHDSNKSDPNRIRCEVQSCTDRQEHCTSLKIRDVQARRVLVTRTSGPESDND